MRSEKELISGCLKQHPDAQRELFERFAPRVKGICLRYSQNSDDASDLLQEVFISVYTGIAQFRGDSSLGTWISSIAIRTAISFVKKRRSVNETEINEHADMCDEKDEESSIYSLDPEAVLKEMEKLPPGYNAILNLYVVDGLTHREIAESLGISEGTSKSQLSRARKMLMELLKTNKMISI
jgi:RNA polymerase sigma factor (sigma-70 family)